MNGIWLAALLFSLSTALPSSAYAQAAPDLAAPKEAMAMFLGDWNFAAEGPDTPFQKAGKWHGVLHGEWFPGKFAVVRRNQMLVESGPPTQVLQVLYFDKTSSTYHLFEVTEDGFTAVEAVTLSGNTMTAHFDQTLKGEVWHMRWSLTMTDPDHRFYLREYSKDGQNWFPCWKSAETRRGGDGG